MVENSLDAGATRIDVAIAHGGTDLIRVVDDGSGMTAEEAHLALKRHATSKLAALDDLLDLRTMGFRGEALPSIGAAARLLLVSRPHAAPNAHAITVEGGAVGTVAPAAGPPGKLGCPTAR